jgi:peroxygenase
MEIELHVKIGLQEKLRRLRAVKKPHLLRCSRSCRLLLFLTDSLHEFEFWSSAMTMQNGRGEDILVYSIRDVPVTEERKPYLNPGGRLQHTGKYSLQFPPRHLLTCTGTARANLAPSAATPQGTTRHNWAEKHSHQTVLQQHCDFFDRDHDGVLWPQDTFTGFHRLGFGIILSWVAVLVIHGNFSYPTVSGWLPDPFFRVFLKNIHKDKHGSDTGTYDTEGRFIPQRFEDIFSKYADGRDYLTIWDLSNVLKGQRCIADPIGWGGAFFECERLLTTRLSEAC